VGGVPAAPGAPDTAPAALQDTALEEESKRRQAAAELYAQVGNPHIWMVETCFPMFSCRFSFQPSYEMRNRINMDQYGSIMINSYKTI
jgi:hypothetical protein